MPRHLPRTPAFWLISATNVIVLSGAAAPTPLYADYQRLWGFSTFTLTVIFAVYAIALLTSLLTVGSLSDHLGRRPVLTVAIIGLIASMAVFMTADGVAMLITARVVQGLTTGAMAATFSATLVDLQPSPRHGATIGSAAPPFALALGSLVAGVLVQYAPHPRLLVYLVTALALVLVLAVLAVIPETSPRLAFPTRAHLYRHLTPRLSLPPQIRATFLAGVPMLATWSLPGLYLSLGPSIITQILGVRNHALTGVILFAFFASAATGAALATLPSTTVTLWTSRAALSAGILTTLHATTDATPALYVAGSIIAGAGFGAAFVGVMTSLAKITAPTDRGRVFTAVFVVSYAAFSIPAVIAGLTVAHIGLRDTAIGYSIGIVTMMALATAIDTYRTRPTHTATPHECDDDADTGTQTLAHRRAG